MNNELILEKLRQIESKVKLAVPENKVIVERTLLFGRWPVKTVITHIDLKEHWMAEG